MQFREKGKQVLVIKTEYRKEHKRTFPVTVASQPRWMTTVSQEVCQQLSKEDCEDFQKWLDRRQENKVVDRQKSELSFLAGRLTQAADGLDAGIEIEGDVQPIFEAVDRLKKSLRKAGYKPAEKQKQSPAANDRQADLLSAETP